LDRGSVSKRLFDGLCVIDVPCPNRVRQPVFFDGPDRVGEEIRRRDVAREEEQHAEPDLFTPG